MIIGFIYDYSFELDGDMPDVSGNRTTLSDDSPPVRYGNSFKRYLRTMWRMRGTFGEEEGLYQTKRDVPSGC